jgi:hypothetical protein
MPLLPNQEQELKEKLDELLEAQAVAFANDCKRLKLDKQEQGKDVNWDLYVAKAKKHLTEYYQKEFRASRVQYTRDYLEANKRK